MKEKSTVNTTTKVALEYCLEALNISNRLESAMISEDYHIDDIDNVRELRKRIQSSMQVASEMYARSLKDVARKDTLSSNVFKKAMRLLRGK